MKKKILLLSALSLFSFSFAKVNSKENNVFVLPQKQNQKVEKNTVNKENKSVSLKIIKRKEENKKEAQKVYCSLKASVVSSDGMYYKKEIYKCQNIYKVFVNGKEVLEFEE